MSQTIHILPESLCNQIAAGEVVERPASVVKELVENSLDAGATRIQVDIESGGKRLIRVADNGCGMSREDAFLCLERHATSKVRAQQDLFRLTTLGFRGEALPSIAAVSRFCLRTRVAESVEGWEIVVEGGTVKRSCAAGVPPGTTMEIRNLFFNTPARRKFLRRDETELGHVGETLTRLALSCPEVCLRFTHNGRMLWEVNRQKRLVERVAELLGRDAVREMMPLEQSGPGDMRLHGLVSTPRLNRSGLGGMYTFINGRFIRDKVVQHALADGYRNLLAKGRYPVLVLFLEVDPSQVDVNVHPTKHEVRFRQQAQVHDFIVEALRARLKKSSPPLQKVSTADTFTRPVRQPAVFPKTGTSSGTPDKGLSDAPAIKSSVSTARPTSDSTCVQEPKEPYLPPAANGEGLVAKTGSSGEGLFDTDGCEDLQGPDGSGGFFAGLHIIGQYQNSYVVCQSGQDLVLVDQHAAHERIGFEQLKQQYRAGSVERQLLLFPVILEFDFRQARLVEEHGDALFRLGISLESFGGNAFALKEVPRMLKESDAERLVRDVVDELAAIGRSKAVEIELERILLKMACHGMVRANQRLTREEMQALLETLDKTPFSSNCPHGRPTYLRWTLGELERLFKRA